MGITLSNWNTPWLWPTLLTESLFIHLGSGHHRHLSVGPFPDDMVAVLCFHLWGRSHCISDHTTTCTMFYQVPVTYTSSINMQECWLDLCATASSTRLIIIIMYIKYLFGKIHCLYIGYEPPLCHKVTIMNDTPVVGESPDHVCWVFEFYTRESKAIP